MSRLMRTSEIVKRPVVTLAGEDVAQVRDVIFAAAGGELGGFTLAGRGLFGGPLKQALGWGSVLALGTDAVMVRDVQVLDPVDAVVAQAAKGGGGGNVLKSEVLTDAGVSLGTVSDVIVQVTDGPDPRCDVVGYEIESSEALGTKGTKVLIPLPDTISASGQHLIVPATAKDFVSQDLAGFGASISAFRAQLQGGAA